MTPKKLSKRQERLIEEIANELPIYLLDGNLTSFTKELDPNLNINNIEKLLRIHFILTEAKNENDVGVIDFIRKLSIRLRRIKTIVNPKKDTCNGSVKGRINWRHTIKLRNNYYPMGKVLFICERRERNYDIPENFILKKLLQIIYNILFEDLEKSINNKKENKWFKNWIELNEQKRKLLDDFFQIFHKNIYLKRIILENIRITNRMINKTLNSRLQIYRDAAKLLIRYRKLINYDLDETEAKELLKNTFIIPGRESVLFELYWIIKIIKCLNVEKLENFKYELRYIKNNLVAKWSDGKFKYRIYHDSIGDLKLHEKITEIRGLIKKIGENNYLGRQIKIQEKLMELISGKSNTLWKGRPDIILEKINENEEIIKILIGEVKNTSHKDYAIAGLRELLEYIALLKKKGENKYIENYSNLFENLGMVIGILFTYKVNI
ncbi:MAG: hypothetical protein ACTSQP_22930 [Promethearchaeota archaeon]